jgi:hypothetical protein
MLPPINTPKADSEADKYVRRKLARALSMHVKDSSSQNESGDLSKTLDTQKTFYKKRLPYTAPHSTPSWSRSNLKDEFISSLFEVIHFSFFSSFLWRLF